MAFFQRSSNIKIDNSNFNEIHGNATFIRFGDGQFTKVQRDLICDYMANLAVLPDIHQNLKRANLSQSIIGLPRAEAVFDDYQTKKKNGPCFEGTRVALLQEMANWITGTDESKMYILSGLAGIGKSTVAYTVASRAANLNLLGASFFFSRYEDNRKDAKKFFTTLAYQLCVYDETFAKVIGDALQTQCGSAAITKSPQEQLQALIIGPLWHIVQSRTRPILVVVDALDECDEEDWFSVLAGLKQLVQTLPPFKVILTTRPQPYLDRFFTSQDGHRIFRLQDIEDKIVDGDIRLYLNHCLSLQQVQECLLGSQWCASNEEIESLVRAAGRLFIIASTVVRIILDKIAFNPAAQMQRLLGTFAEDRMPFKGLSEFYTVILRNVVPVDCHNNIVKRYQSVVGAIISVQQPLPVPTLAHLIDIEVTDIRAVLVNLQSVVLLDDRDIPRIYHKSFPDYIMDSELCRDVKLHIDQMSCHTCIIIRCFQIMEQHLKYNILGLDTPARFMNNEDGLTKEGIMNEQLERGIPGHLQYACVYWANHLGAANIEDGDLMKGLKQFLYTHMLHWFEVLSLVRKLNSAHHAIRVVLKVLNPISPDLLSLLSDGLRFISKFYSIIERSALHTYYSALPFTPTNSLLYRQHIKGASHNICNINGGPKEWDALVANLSHGKHHANNIKYIKFSPDCTMFASLDTGMLKVWEAVSGNLISTLRGARFAIANNLSTAVSFKGRAITLHDVNGDQQPTTTFVTGTEILAVAISSESNRISAVLYDRTLHLWNNRNEKLIGVFDEISSYRRDRGLDWGWGWDWDWNRLQFSATGARLAYSSAGRGFIHLRNGIDGSFIANLDCESILYRTALSADGSRIATLFKSCLKVWSCEDGKLVGTTQNAHYRLAISANGSFLATGNHRQVILWSGNSQKGDSLTQMEDLHLDIGYHPDFSFGFGLGMRPMAFSSSDTLAITTSDGIKLYNVNDRTFISTLSFADSTALAFSSDSTCLTAGNNDGMVYLWDVRGIEASGPPSNKQAKEKITALALSRDCSQLACGFEDGTVELWETNDLLKLPIAAQERHPSKLTALGWSPDGREFVSGSNDGTINLWDGKNRVLHDTVRYPTEPLALEVSNTKVAVAGVAGLFLWDLRTLSHIHTFYGSFKPCLSFSADGVLLAAVRVCYTINRNSDNYLDSPSSESYVTDTIVINVMKHTIISTFDVDCHAMAFLLDNSQLVVQPFNNTTNPRLRIDDGADLFAFNLKYRKPRRRLTFNLKYEKPAQTPTLMRFRQLRHMPLHHDIPVSIKYEEGQWCLKALPSQRNQRAPCAPAVLDVPVLWIPHDLNVQVTANGPSMIALGCANGHIILLHLCTIPLG